MPLVSADAEVSALSEFVALLLVGDKPGDRAWGNRQGCGCCSALSSLGSFEGLGALGGEGRAGLAGDRSWEAKAEQKQDCVPSC